MQLVLRIADESHAIVYVRMRSLSVDYGYIINVYYYINYIYYINYLNELINLLQTLLGWKHFLTLHNHLLNQSSQVTLISIGL